MKEKSEKETKRRLPKLPIIIAAVLFAVVLIVGAAVLIVIDDTKSLTVEVGSELKISDIVDNPVLSPFCKINDIPDTDIIGDYPVRLEFFGIIIRNVTVSVRDTQPPIVELYNISSVQGIEISSADFIKSISDLSETSVGFAGESPSFSSVGKYEISVCVTDASGNSTTETAVLEITDEEDAVIVEYGDDDCSDEILKKYPDAVDQVLSDIDTHSIGTYTARLHSGDTYRIITVSVVDTVPPECEVTEGIFRNVYEIELEKLVSDITDISEVNVRLADPLALKSEGIQDVELILEDAYGNTSSKTTRIGIFNIPEKASIEYGFTRGELERLLYDELVKTDEITLGEDFSPESYGVGEHEIFLTCELGEIPVKLTVKDYTSPELVLKELSIYAGTNVDIMDFVQSCTDVSPVEYTFVSEPQVDVAGLHIVTVVATDSYGNTAEKQTYLQILTDIVPPVIYGVRDINAIAGEGISYRSGVYAVDDVDGNVEVSVDTSDVNLNRQGVYTVIYTAVDSFGNTAIKTAKLTITGITIDVLNEIADEILDTLITYDMSYRDRAWAIYTWCENNIKYSTRTAYLMGNFNEGAYSGFKIRSGNCYTFYAVASVLLTRAGIENMEIQRNDPDNPHYWNLVKMDGNWYHFDTCPHYAGHTITAFLLTDAEVKKYSEDEVKDYYSFDPSLYPATP